MGSFSSQRKLVSRRAFLGGSLILLSPPIFGQSTGHFAVTFIFISDVHACRMNSGLSPNCLQEGKTDRNLLRHIAALNNLPRLHWPTHVNGAPSGLDGAGRRIEDIRGIVLGGDMTDDGGGQTTTPREGTQLLQFSHRYQQGVGPDRVHFPVYAGLGNHDLDQDGPASDPDWYRQELRDYVQLNHEPGPLFRPPVPAMNFDRASDCYSWDWGGLHLIQAHRFAGDTRKGAVSAMPWLKKDLDANASNGKPVVIFQHYGWDPFSLERWDPSKTTFDDDGHGEPHWWSEEERKALLATIKPYNVIGLFHGHEHPTPMIYAKDGLDLFKPKASFMGGFALARVTDKFMNVTLGEAKDAGEVTFTSAFHKQLT